MSKMSTDETTPKLTAGRGGRGAAIYKALLSLPRYPGQTTEKTEPSAAVPPLCVSGGEDVQVAGATALCSPRSDESSVTSVPSVGSSRGAIISQLMKRRSFTTSSPIATPVTSSAEVKEKICPEPVVARGRAEFFRSHFMGLTKTQPLKSDSQDLSDKLSLTESVQHLNITDTKDDAVIRQGTTGTKFSAMTNWIRLSIEENKAVFEYEVKFEPPIDALNLRFRLLNSIKDEIGSVKSFDGSILWLPIKLPNEIVQHYTTNPFTKETVTVKIIYKKRSHMDKSVQLYNVLFNRIMKVLKMARVGRSYYAPRGSVLVPQHKLEIWPGYVTAVSYQEGGIMLCCDVSHRILRTETCYEILTDLCEMQRSNFKAAAAKALVGCIVLTRYNNRSYRIDDILFDQNAESTFKNYKGEEVRYVDYYYDAYGIKIKDPRQPLLLHRTNMKDGNNQGSKRVLCLIPELCYMTGMTDDMRSDFRVMKDIAQHTRITPTVRQASLRTFIKNVNETPEAHQILADWGLKLHDCTVPLEGRILPPETIYFANNTVPGLDIADWGRDACREKVIVPVDVKPRCWLMLFCAKDQQRAHKFGDMLKQVTRNMGIHVGEPQMVYLPNDETQSYVNSLKQFYHDALQLAVIIFPSQREDRYAAVKRVACLELALATQCIMSRTISHDAKLRSVTQKIALQINCKLGGELWALKIPITGLMVCGIDVYHDPTRRGASTVGFVASINQTLTKWYSHVSFQHPGDEIVHGLKICLLEAIRHYHKLHHTLPRSIMMYRDGVSDGQLKLVEDHELPQLASIFHNFQSYEPKLYLIIVQKRLNTRIFSTMSSRGLDNPPPGSIIDHSITRRYWYDFLLVSQHVRQGTVSPTHYVVVHDGGNLKVDNMQRLTYKLTHLYYNWPGTIRVPAPCQYAHKLAFLIGKSVKKEPAVELCDKLFFL
ncbi:piwi-like protein Ago3 isoform X2 [Procambarus clarkii]|uniref:piwi-like protein Ago3 isoform X2 n=1 Tax=Procambarus clarkii TaxID=6728 RepID=UPI0037424BC2